MSNPLNGTLGKLAAYVAAMVTMPYRLSLELPILREDYRRLEQKIDGALEKWDTLGQRVAYLEGRTEKEDTS